jgi:hypothetical protein
MYKCKYSNYKEINYKHDLILAAIWGFTLTKNHFFYKHFFAYCRHGWFILKDPSISAFSYAPNHDDDNLHPPSLH